MTTPPDHDQRPPTNHPAVAGLWIRALGLLLGVGLAAYDLNVPENVPSYVYGLIGLIVGVGHRLGDLFKTGD